MYYKNEVQKRNTEKLQMRFEQDNVPEFIRRLFSNIGGGSKATALSYWIAVRDLLQYVIDSNVIKKSCISDIEPNDMVEIEASEVNDYLEEKEKKGMSPTTLQVRKNIFKSFWKEMMGTVKIPVQTNVINNVSYKGISYNPDNILLKLPSEKDVNLMLEKIKRKKDNFIRERNTAIISLLMGTGIRESELAGLDVSDLFLNVENPYIKVIGKGGYRKQSARTVFLSEEDTVCSLKYWMGIRKNVGIIVDDKALFLTKKGKRMNEDNIKSMFKNYSCRKITPQQMRHLYATIFSEKYGVEFVRQQLGHRSANTTINNYMDARLSVMKKIKGNGDL